ncbi:DUF2264 domain-containing protein [Lactiplantibacillus daoliensis]|uniref:DUF2264 domain-containing protein n=1 Tax=Lactiplantibacillus daoliensis TaxID=2559916 RepID=A0ABW1UIT9_9LACO|nr:DUF2264 domain-containing protein [Lactiplantibacillus daoliensis]
MNHFNSQLKDNPLKTRADYVQALLALVKPVYDLMADEKKLGRVRISDSGSVYDEPRREIEGFLRTLWGIGPLCSTAERAEQYRQYFTPATQGIVAGCDPQSPFYWGDLTDYDQLFVEMGSLATMLILTKPFFYDRLTPTEQQNIYHWLDQINHRKIPQTNWLFFRVLVNTFFEKAQLADMTDQIDQDLTALDSYYLEDGWYFDGYRNQIDYYIPFAMQYYGVLYSVLAADKTEAHVAKFAQRGQLFSKTFKDWFVKNGTALPFGRSQTYRFAQSAFWAASAFAKLPITSTVQAEGKYLLGANMHQWFSLPIFTSDNLLSIGYGYPNLVFAEGYNAPGSPYWALKNFIVLALPDDDPFWQLPTTIPSFPVQTVNQASRMLLVHADQGQELQAFTAGQHSHEHAHGEDKYEKYVYSTTFGFSVKKGSVLPKQGAYDNTLAISETDTDYRTAFGYQKFAIHDDYVYSQWQPWSDVTIDNFIVPVYPWHIRIHLIQTARNLNLLEGSFSAPNGGVALTTTEPQQALYNSSVGATGIVGLTPNLTASLSEPEPNTNVFFPKTVLPLISGSVTPGKQLVITACLGDAHQQVDVVPPVTVKLDGQLAHITIGSQHLDVTLTELAN